MPERPAIVGRSKRPLLALLGGALVALSMPPWGFWPLAVVGIIVFEVALGDALTRRQRGWLGFAFGTTWMFIALAWMWYLTAPGYVVSCVMFAGLHAAAAAYAPDGPWRTIGRPATHTLVEIVRMSFPFGGVPLATLGISQAGGPLLGLARLGGVIVLTWVVFQIGFASAPALRAALELLRRRGDDQQVHPHLPQRHGLWAMAAVVLVIVLGAVAPKGSDVRAEPMRIAAVQGGGAQGTSALDVPSSRVTQAHLDATATIEPSAELDLVVWPENGIDVDDQPFEGSTAHSLIAAEAERLGVPFAVGVTVDAEYSAYPTNGGFVNAQIVVSATGEIVSSYEKVHIVPFGEYVPMRGLLEAFGAPLDQIPSDAVRGRDPARIALADGTELGVMISWEVFFGASGRAADDGAILINPTNGASYTLTILQTQQVASSKLRAVETGRWVVQVSPTGFSAFVSPNGDVWQRTDVGERRVITMDIPMRHGTTWYSTLGDWPWIVLMVILVGVSSWFGGRRERPIADPA